MHNRTFSSIDGPYVLDAKRIHHFEAIPIRPISGHGHIYSGGPEMTLVENYWSKHIAENV